MTCIYYFHDEYVLKFNLHFLYKGHIYDVPISEKVLSLLKYTWFTSQMLSFDDMGRIGEKNYNYVTNINVYKIVNELKIISGEKTFYGRDSESTSFAERWIINTDDFYILNTLLNFSETHYPPPCNYHNHKLCMYGSRFAIEYKLFKKHHLFLRAKLDVIAKLIEDKKMEFNVKDCIKYILLEKYLLNQRPSHTLSIQCCPLDTEYIEKEKSETIITEFINTYSVGKHLGGLLYIQSEAIKVPSKMMNEITISYNEWRLKEIQNSGLEHLTSYWSAKEICDEFNKRSNKRFNFRFDFSLFDNIPLADNEFSGFDWETYLGTKSDN